MHKLVNNYTRFTLVAATTLLSIAVTLFVLFIGYQLMGEEIRKAEIIIAIIAPLLIASTVTWYLYGLIKKLDCLQQELRQRMTKEKENVYLATIQGAQHITNNLLNQLTLIDMEIRKHPSFDAEILKLFNEMRSESKALIDDLSSVKQIHPEAIKRSVDPK